MKLKHFTLGLAMTCTAGIGWAQQRDSTDLYSFSLEELMNIQIESASKKVESLFDASLSASVLTREEIKHSGVTSIMEALRLVPGVIVREISNGNYDIHVRGLDNVPPNSLILASTNTTTLVMINNRPVYNYLQGGTFWESLPIDLNDVEKIEVVRGPSSTLYGPNAVSGVINIITTRLANEGLTVRGTGQYGSLKTGIANASVGYKFNDKFDITVSGNTQVRDRSNGLYYNNATHEWVNSPADLNVPNADERYPDPSKSMKKYGANAFVNYRANSNSRFSLATGLQDSKVQSIMFDNPATNISTTTTNSKYVDFQSQTYGLTTQLSYVTAVQAPVLGMQGSKYDYNVVDASAEYDINIHGLSVKPGVTYRSATYDDGTYSDIANGGGTFGGSQTMNTFGGGLRLDYKFLQERMRFTGGVRMDKFTYPSKWFASYQAALSYKVNDKNIIRAVYSRAYRSPFIFDTFVSYTSVNPIGAGMYSQYAVTGNKNMALLHSDMMELGYRSMLMSNLSLDIEGYYTKTSNYSALIQDVTVLTPENYPIVANTSMSIENIPMTVHQTGVSLSITAVISKVQIKPFITLQNTKLEDYSQYFSTTNAAPGINNNFDPANYNVNSGIGTETNHKFTPKAYGGAQINYSFAKFNVNVNTYWFSKQTFYQLDNTLVNDGTTGIEHISGKALVNAKVSYSPVKALSIFVTGKNLLNQKSIEYYKSDATPAMVLGGVSFDF
ncbi:MAG: TonB-dependent receptor [Chryseolinea sp.]